VNLVAATAARVTPFTGAKVGVCLADLARVAFPFVRRQTVIAPGSGQQSKQMPHPVQM
jgi:hypothetical protein